jgi:autotransporter translocation and assembly factor TamB
LSTATRGGSGRRRWLRWLLAATLLLPLLAAAVPASVLYVPALSRWAVERANVAANELLPAQIDIERVEGRLGSEIVLRGVRIQDHRGEPAVEAQVLRLRWRPWQLLKRSLVIEELHLAGPRVSARIGEDGAFNLVAAFMPAGKDAPQRPPPAERSRKPLRIEVRLVEVQGGSFRLDRGEETLVELSEIRVAADWSLAEGAHNATIGQLRFRPRAPMDIDPIRLSSGPLRLAGSDLFIDGLDLRWRDNRLHAEGYLNDLSSVRPRLRIVAEHLDLGDLSDVLADGDESEVEGLLRGIVTADLLLGGRVEDLNVRGQVAVDGAGSIEIESARVGLAADPLEHEAVLRVDGLSPGAVLTSVPELPSRMTGQLQWRGRGTSLDNLAGNLALRLDRLVYRRLTAAGTRVDASIGEGRISVPQLDAQVAGGRLRGQVEADLNQSRFGADLQLTLPDVGALQAAVDLPAGPGSIELSAAVDGSWAPQLALDGEVALVANHLTVARVPVDSLNLHWDGDLDLRRPSAPRVNGHLQLTADGVQLGTRALEHLRLEAHAEGTEAALELRAADADHLGLDAGGRLDWTQPGEIRWSGQRLDLELFDLDLRSLRPFGVLRSADGIEVTELQLGGFPGTLAVDARYDPSGSVSAAVSLSELDLGLLQRMLPEELALTGRVQGLSIDLNGALASPQMALKGHLNGASIGGKGPADIGFDLRATTPPEPEGEPPRAKLEGHFDIEDLVRLEVNSVPLALNFSGKGKVATLLPDGAWDVDLWSPAVNVDRWSKVLELRLPDHLRRVSVEPMERWLELLDQSLPKPLQSCAVGAHLGWKGTTADPEIVLRLSLRELSAGGETLAADLTALLSGGRLRLERGDLHTDPDSPLAQLELEAPFELGALLVRALGPDGHPAGRAPQVLSELNATLRTSSLPMPMVHTFVPKLRPLEGMLNGTLTLRGPLSGPEAGLEFDVSEASLAGQAIRGFDLEGSVEGGRMRASLSVVPEAGGSLQVRGSATLPLALDGSRGLREMLGVGDLRVDLAGEDVPLAMALAFVDGVEVAEGTFALGGQVRGSILDPRPRLAVSGQGGKVCYEPTGMCYSQLAIDLDLVPRRMTVRALAFDAFPSLRAGVMPPLDQRPGTFSATGTVDLEGFRPRDTQLNFELERFWGFYTPSIKTRFNATASISGVWPELLVDGDVELDDGKIEIGEEDEADTHALMLPENLHVHRSDSERGPGERLLISEEPAEERSSILQTSTLRLRLAVTENVRTIIKLGVLGQSTDAVAALNRLGRIRPDLHLAGEVELVLDRGQATLVGSLKTGRHSKLTVLGRTFELDEDGGLTFVGKPLNTELDLTAIFKSDYGPIAIHVTGPVSEPVIEFESEELDDPADMMSVLVVGKPLDQLGTGEDKTALAQVASGLSGFGTSLAGKVLPVDTVKLDFDESFEAGSAEVGKSFGRRVYVFTRFRWGADEDENVVEGQLDLVLTRGLYLRTTLGDKLQGSFDIVWKTRF